jgi:hypothetical protein
VEPTAFRDLPAEKPLEKGPSFKEELPREIALSDALDQRARGTMALSTLKQRVATLLDNAGGIHLAGAMVGTGSTEKAAGEDFLKAVGPFPGVALQGL